MAKRFDDLDAAMRKIAAQRDDFVRDQGAISADRLQRLHSVLASELPVETALSQAAKQRDETLSAGVPVIPTFVEAALAERLLTRPTLAPCRESVSRYGNFLQTLWRFVFVHAPRPLSVATVVALLTIGVVLFSHWSTRRSGIVVLGGPLVQASPDATTTGGVAYQARSVRFGDYFLPASGNQLTLRVSTTELASLQPSLLIATYLPEHDAGLPLDLPVRQILMDTEEAMTP